MISFPPCKINLGLHVVAKRTDGYHELETCFYPIPWTDILEIIPSQENTFSSSGNSIPGDSKNNLCLKAYQILDKEFKLPPVSIHLHKVIPTGAGLGGGSADAAHTLRLLNVIFELGISSSALMNYAAQLGNDCAFFIQDEPMMGKGRGEILTPANVSLKGKFALLIKPEIHVSTADAYAHVTPASPVLDLDTILQKPLSEWKSSLQNNFENSVFLKYPELEEIKTFLYNNGAIYSCMSGSGSTIFGIFENPVHLPAKGNYTMWSGTL